MKALTVSRITNASLGLNAAAEVLAGETQHAIDVVNWPAFDYRPQVAFAMGYGADDLYIRFAVQENAVLAEKTRTNESVCQDSCVEMFIAPQSEAYFNFEFNCIGTALVGQGHGREDLQRLDVSAIADVRRLASLGTAPFAERREPTEWTLTVAIPLRLLGLSEAMLPGHSSRANFYKCGDRLSTQHYLSWNPVSTASPDFHRPECFGVVKFV